MVSGFWEGCFSLSVSRLPATRAHPYLRGCEMSTRRTRFGTIRFYGPRPHEVAIIKCMLQNLIVLGSTHQAHRVILGRAYSGHHMRPPWRRLGWKPEPPSSRPEGNQEARRALRRPVDLRAQPVRHHALQAFHYRRTDRGRDGLDGVDSGPGRGSARGPHRESAPDGNRDAGWGARGALRGSRLRQFPIWLA